MTRGQVDISELHGGCCVDGVCAVDEVDDVGEAIYKQTVI